MVDVYLTNTLTRKKEKFIPVKDGSVGIYSCGPTVYWNQHIGHMYAYVQWDCLVRFLRYVGYQVKWVMNITDVGHMTSDADQGEDKMEKGAAREGVSVWDIANKYIDQFQKSMELLNIACPDQLARVTQHIPDQIELIKKIENRGFTYKTKMGVVYDTAKFGGYTKFAGLNLDQLKVGTRQEEDPEKKAPWDFFLWVTGQPNHIMQWDSPWGKGFPGWHIECTAISTKYLGENFDIHTGGIEHIPVHHTNEIAQGFAAFGKQTANYWLHNSHLLGLGGEKMSKSLGNFVTAQDLVDKGYDPLALRYLILTSHYKKGLRFSWEALSAAGTALKKMREYVVPTENAGVDESYKDKFIQKISDDLDMPGALAVVWEMLKSNLDPKVKSATLSDFDRVLGLKLAEKPRETEVPEEVRQMLVERDRLRSEGNFAEADQIRKKIESKGFILEDTPGGVKLKNA